jgi:hypothetical protein
MTADPETRAPTDLLTDFILDYFIIESLTLFVISDAKGRVYIRTDGVIGAA